MFVVDNLFGKTEIAVVNIFITCHFISVDTMCELEKGPVTFL